MIDPPKPPETETKQESAPHHRPRPNDGDVHAMQAHLNKPEGAGNALSSLFSSQTKQVCTDPKHKTGTDDLEQRLRRHQADQEEENHPGQQPEDGEDDPEDLAQEVAEHILVSDKAHLDQGAGNEVRIKIKNTILKDAHVHLVREPDCLQVKLISSHEQSVQTLVAARYSLEKQLEKNYKGLIKISIIHLNQKGEAQVGNNE
ncbi:MAG: hypothetical protein JEZ12_25640 [Desulfobacterium sp.]|nr:hypothetical protein [Desulfobacterium sp.]